MPTIIGVAVHARKKASHLAFSPDVSTKKRKYVDELQSITFTTVAWKAWPLKKTATPIQFPSFQWHRDGFSCSKWSRNKGSTTSHHIPPFAQTFHGGPVGSMLNLEPSGQACAVHLFYYKGRGQLFELDAWHSTELRLFQVGGNGSNMIFAFFFFLHGLVYVRKLPGYMDDIVQLELGMRSIYPLVKNITFFSINEHAINNLYIATCSVINLKLQSISIHFRKTKTYKRDTFSIVMLCYVRLVSIYKNPRKLQLPGSTMTSAWPPARPPARAWANANWLQLSTCGMHSQVAHTS